MTAHRGPLVALAAVLLAYILLGFVLLAPDTLYSGDIGVQYVQSRTLAAHRFVRMWLDYPGEFLDGRRQFFPFLPPFAFRSHGHREVIFPPARAMLTAPFAVAGGLRGMVVLSIGSAIVALGFTCALAAGPWRSALPLVLGFATCFWFYAVVPLAHTPSMAMALAAFWIAGGSTSPHRAIAAGALVATAGLVRDEFLAIVPALLFAVWYRERSWRPVLTTLASAVGVLAIAGAIEVFVYQRPLAAHPRHAVSSLRAMLQMSGSANQDVPAIPPFTTAQRYDVVFHQWIVGLESDWYLAGFATLLLVALAVHWWMGSAAGVLLASAVVLALAARDASYLIAAPKFVGGLARLSPFLVFALLPAPWRGRDGCGRSSDRPTRVVSYVAIASFIGIALLVVDSVAGKSLGPRILLPILPFATILAWQNIAAYVRSDRGVLDRSVGGIGLALVAVSFAIHLGSTIPALVARNHEERQAIEWVRDAPDAIVVADEEITAQLISPLYFSKVILLVENPQQAVRLSDALMAARVPSVLLVSRSQPPLITLDPYGRASSQTAGRFVVERWVR